MKMYKIIDNIVRCYVHINLLYIIKEKVKEYTLKKQLACCFIIMYKIYKQNCQFFIFSNEIVRIVYSSQLLVSKIKTES